MTPHVSFGRDQFVSVRGKELLLPCCRDGDPQAGEIRLLLAFDVRRGDFDLFACRGWGRLSRIVDCIHGIRVSEAALTYALTPRLEPFCDARITVRLLETITDGSLVQLLKFAVRPDCSARLTDASAGRDLFSLECFYIGLSLLLLIALESGHVAGVAVAGASSGSLALYPWLLNPPAALLGAVVTGSAWIVVAAATTIDLALRKPSDLAKDR